MRGRTKRPNIRFYINAAVSVGLTLPAAQTNFDTKRHMPYTRLFLLASKISHKYRRIAVLINQFKRLNFMRKYCFTRNQQSNYDYASDIHDKSKARHCSTKFFSKSQPRPQKTVVGN